MKPLVLSFALCVPGLLLYGADVNRALEKLSGNDSQRGMGREELKNAFAVATAPGADSAVLASSQAAVVAALNSGTLPLSEQLHLLEVLGLYGDAAAADAVYPSLASNDEHIRDAARKALVLIPGEKAFNYLLAGLKSGSAKERGAFVDALAMRGDVSAVGALAPHLQDAELTDKVAMALGKLGSDTAASSLLAVHASASHANKFAIERALLDLGLNVDAAYRLADSGSSSAIRASAFSQLLELDEGRALRVLKAVVDQPEFVGRSLFFEATMNGVSSKAHDMIVAHLPKAEIADQSIIVTAIGENGFKKYESEVLALINSDNWSLRMDVIHALGNIGGDASLAPLLKAFQSDSKNATIANAVARLQAPSADAKALEQVRGGGSAESRIASMKVLELRNADGATELLNQIAKGDKDQEVRKAAISTLESIGNMDTIQLFIVMMLAEDILSRDVQRSLRRLSLNFGAPDFQWDTAYKPALDSASSDKARESLVLIMDGVESEHALKYLEQNILDESSPLRSASLRTLQRYGSLDSGNTWIAVASQPGASESEVSSAQRSIAKILKSNDWHTSWKRVDLAVKAIKEVDNVEFKKGILAVYQSSPPASQKQHMKTKFKAIENDPDVGAIVKQILASI